MISDGFGMMPALETTRKTQLPWVQVAWFGALMILAYAPVLRGLMRQWDSDEDMSHGFFVPIIAAFIVWQRREELAAIKTRRSWFGLLIVAYGALQLLLGTLAAELFLTRTAFVITLIGSVWFLCGALTVKKLAFPLFLCFFMVPIPSVIYNSLTFPLQLLASRLAEHALEILSVPVLREGNVLILPNQELSVVEACSGIRSLLSLTFLSLVYGHFFEKRLWVKVALFAATIPIAIIANGSRVTLTGVLTQFNPELAEGFFHTASGWVIFMVALVALIFLHQVLTKLIGLVERRRSRAISE